MDGNGDCGGLVEGRRGSGAEAAEFCLRLMLLINLESVSVETVATAVHKLHMARGVFNKLARKTKVFRGLFIKYLF